MRKNPYICVMNKFSIGDRVKRINGSVFPSSGSNYGIVVGFDEWNQWLHIEGEYFDSSRRDGCVKQEINYHNPDFLEYVDHPFISENIKNHQLIS
jgi:hypothetical protein